MSDASPCPTAQALAAAFTAGKTTAEAVIRETLERIAVRDATLGAFVVVGADEALEQARAWDKARKLGDKVPALAGVPLAVKDNIDTVDLPTAYGSDIYHKHQPVGDAACVAQARSAGAIVVGKTVTTEFAYYRPGKTVNPHDPARTPGGSSQGSAAAVGAGLVPLAFGTQTAGSIIRPAAYCGCVGYKPTWGLIPRAGVKVISDWLDTVGLIARDVEDAAFCAAGLTSRPGLKPETGGSFKIAVLREPYPGNAEPEAVHALDRAMAALEKAGHAVRDLPTPPALQQLAKQQRLVMAYEMDKALADERRRHEAKLSSILKSYLDEGRSISARAYDGAIAATRELIYDIGQLFGDADAILSPPAPGEAPMGLQATGDPAFNRVWTQLQLPCLTLPAGTGPNGMPVGVQLAARAGQDALLFAVALATENALKR